MKSKILKVISVAAALLLWQVAATLISADFLLASPISVLKSIFSLFKNGEVFGSVWYSFARIAGGFLLSSVAGAVLAVLASRSHVLETLLWPYMLTVKTVPVASFIVIALIWLSSSMLSVFIAFLMVLPIIYNNVLSGIKSTDRKMTEMAEVFSLSYKKRFIYIALPTLKPFLRAGFQTAIGFAFKSGIAAEIIGIPNGSLGERLYSAKVHLETAELFAYTIIIVLLSVAFEKLFLLMLDKLFKVVEKR
ncbi:MAG: ABC transporter permease subunit [Clostridia bacterium]|nr:ABC transporter permease subunit [Clostridia bacterium]MBQ2273928.1 ABC transporter permease subunit [Clostridia bacterium]MBQ5798289.1 ABC transporter permease subunit [Clostridia bacterium]MEE1278208.1 ABC transporter permease subunit [Acutalibacteraceae bacterium]